MPLQRGQVEDVLQALAVGLEHDRERAVVARDLKQALGLQPLLPQRRALARAAGAGSGARGRRSRGSARRRAPSAPPPARRAPRSRRASRSRSAIGGSTSASGRCSAIPSSDQIDCTSSPSASRRRAPSAIAHGACTRAPNGRQDAEPPVADLVAEALDHDRAVGRDDAAVRRRLVAEVGEEVLRRERVEVVVAAEPLERLRDRRAPTISREARPIFSPSSNGRPTPSPFQNGTAPGAPGAGETSTRSRVISSIRQVEAPSMNVCPWRAS